MADYLTRVAVDEDVQPCTHCNGNGVEPGERDLCSMCDGTGVEEEE